MIKNSRTTFLSTLLFIVLLITSCGDEARTPAYVKILEPAFNTFPNQGTNFHNSTSCFIFHNTTPLGGFVYGNEIPILEEETDVLQLFPGIRVDGLVDQPNIYGMMDFVTINQDLIAGETYEFTPTFNYLSNVNFRINEDFEGGTGFTLDIDEDDETKLRIVENAGFNNSDGGVMTVSEDNPLSATAWQTPLTNFPLSGSIYCEVTYKGTANLTVSVLGSSSNGQQIIPRVVLFPSEEWEKVYIDFGSDIRQSALDFYQLAFSISHDGSDGEVSATIDDVKFLHLE